MHYYQHHIGDFIKDTNFLTNEEVGIYLKLLWLYYDTEKPLENDLFTLTMKTSSRGNEDMVTGILTMFFTLVDNVWFHARCQREIDEYHKMLESKSRAGKASAEHRKNRNSTRVEQTLDKCHTDVQLTINHKPITNNQEKTKTIARVPRFDAQAHLLSLGVDVNVANDFLALRKQKRAALTLTALAGIAKEAGKAGMTLQQALEISCARGWQSFKADWIQNDIGKRGDNKPDWAVEKENRIRAFAGDSAAKPQTQITGNIIDITPQPKLIGG